MKSEFEFIEQLRKRSKIQNLKSKIKNGIGDDCAVIRQNTQTDLVITTDLLVEDIDFRLEWATAEAIGHKALAVSLSDIAAMGATPAWALISIGVPTAIWQSDFVEKFYEGWFALGKKFNVELIGGDVSRTPDRIVIDSIVAGTVKKNRAVLRSGAQTGDLIFVTGELGGAAAGLNFLEKKFRFNKNNSETIQKLILRQLNPFPQIEAGKLLAKKKLATAMIDVSDGLSSDLIHLCQSSKVGAKIYADRIPIDTKLKKCQKKLLLKKFEFDIFALALNGGEDFELLFTAKAKNAKKIEKRFPNFFCIGEIIDDADKIELISDSATISIKARGFQHF